jgi:glycosyltransferase involved in cell wall biosynthesis
VDLDRFSPAGPRVDLDALAGLPPARPDTIRVGLVAAMARWKGHEIFLRALSMLPERLPVRGYVIGGPIYETRGSQYTVEELRELAARLGVSDKVGFTGFLQDPAAAMRALDIVVHASTQPEPFGRVIAEAMACGRAVIASRSGGAAELVSDGIDALCHPPGSARALAECIARLAADRNLRVRLGETGRAAAAARFDRRRLSSELIAICKEVAPMPV